MSDVDRVDPPRTDDPRVDDALDRVADLDDSPVDEHAARLDAAHAELQQVLRQPDDGSRPGPSVSA